MVSKTLEEEPDSDEITLEEKGDFDEVTLEEDD